LSSFLWWKLTPTKDNVDRDMHFVTVQASNERCCDLTKVNNALTFTIMHSETESVKKHDWIVALKITLRLNLIFSIVCVLRF
jgi:hypothetical protein